MTVARGLIIFGFGGHARSVADVALALGVGELIFVDDNADASESVFGFPARKTFEGNLPHGWKVFPASGDNRKRQVQVAMIHERNWPLACLISPTATVGVQASISPGCLICHHAHVGPLSTVGMGSILNTGAIVDHECRIGEYTHVSVNSSVAGRSRLGSFVFLGTGATVIDNVQISDFITVGAGSVVTRSIVEQGTYVGAPARLIKKL